MFPSGYPGLGLILLRCSLALAVAFASPQASSLLPMTWWLPAQLVMSGTLLLGLMTPVFSATTIGVSALVIAIDGCSRWPLCLLILLMALSLLLIGPGAYSLDARLYGRRRLLPRGNRR